MKLFMIGMIALIFAGFIPKTGKRDVVNINSKFSKANTPTHIIIMEDEIMLHTDTGDPNDLTFSIEVLTTSKVSVLTNTSCQTQDCDTNLDALSPGDYDVVLTTSSSIEYIERVRVK